MSDWAVVTVIHQSERDLERLLSSLALLGPSQPHVVVVDSGSTDDGPGVARRHGATLVTLDGNPGFGVGCNRGLDHVGEPVTALLNPDVELLDGGLETLARDARDARRLLAPRLLNADGSVQDSAHPPPGTLEELVPALVSPRLMGARLRRRYQPWRSPTEVRCGWAIAAALVAPTALLRELGPFDESAFLFYEDMDLCLRAADAGAPTVLRPDVALRHLGGTSTGPALGDAHLELRARRRREVVGRLGRRRLALDDAAQAMTFATRAAGRRLVRRGDGRAGAQLRALRAVRREGG
ncbi:MAG TPA: glycosyltransferase family 2 protein [Thermoleophilaceae bacterium]|nr:glycosyltransferase family 2 protein [Thermoleophilaceae bacterium]